MRQPEVACHVVESTSSVCSAKASAQIFPSVDGAQGEPVTNVATVEGLASFSHWPQEADPCLPGEPVSASSSDNFLSASEGVKTRPFIIELFCGTAGVCAQFKTLGGRAIGVDHHMKRAKLKAAAVQLDLTQQWVQDLIEREIKLKRVDGIHLGPPCGTASRACNIPIKRKLIRKGAPNPQPLRSEKHPLGFPWLRGVNRERVQSANVLYEFSARIALLCEEFGTLFTIENPQNSLLWVTPYFKPLVNKFHMHVADSCEYGSAHKKSTGFLANFISERLQKKCRGDHQHAAWKVKQLDSGEWSFDTAQAAEYPTDLAKEIAAAFMDELSKRGKLVLQDDLADHADKISAEAQPRRPRGPFADSRVQNQGCGGVPSIRSSTTCYSARCTAPLAGHPSWL